MLLPYPDNVLSLTDHILKCVGTREFPGPQVSVQIVSRRLRMSVCSHVSDNQGLCHKCGKPIHLSDEEWKMVLSMREQSERCSIHLIPYGNDGCEKCYESALAHEEFDCEHPPEAVKRINDGEECQSCGEVWEDPDCEWRVE